MKRLILAALPALLLVGMLALPAQAGGPAHIGVAQSGSTAGVGTQYDAGKTCTKAGLDSTDVDGDGLRAPGFKLPGDNGRRVWAISINIVDAPWGLGRLRACGKLKGVLGGAKAPTQLGAWCGMSKGYDGQGKAQPDTKKMHPNGTGLSQIQLTNLHWKFTIGGILPVKGNWEEVPKPDKTKGKANSPRGKVWAVFNAQGAAPCVGLTNPTAQQFTIVGGVYWLAPDALTSAKGKKWNDKGPELANGCRVFEKHDDCWYKAKQ